MYLRPLQQPKVGWQSLALLCSPALVWSSPALTIPSHHGWSPPIHCLVVTFLYSHHHVPSLSVRVSRTYHTLLSIFHCEQPETVFYSPQPNPPPLETFSTLHKPRALSPLHHHQSYTLLLVPTSQPRVCMKRARSRDELHLAHEGWLFPSPPNSVFSVLTLVA